MGSSGGSVVPTGPVAASAGQVAAARTGSAPQTPLAVVADLLGLTGLRPILVGIVGAAQRFAAAQHVAIAVTGAGGRLAEFVEAGVPPAQPPGAAARPEARSRLAIPVLVQGRTFGTLHLAGKIGGGGFGAEDEDLASALAAVAGAAVRDAEIYETAQRRQECSATAVNVVSATLASRPAQALGLVARGARRSTGASIAVLAVPISDDAVVLEACDGSEAADSPGRVVPLDAAPLYRQVLATKRPVVVPDASAGEWAEGSSVLVGSEVGPLMAVPLVAADQCVGLLALADRPGAEPFTILDVEMATTFAAHAALAVQSVAAGHREQRLAVLEDRERIARDLHDGVIQRIFAAGLRLQSLSSALTGRDAEKLAAVTADLDQTIHDVRTTIFSLRAPGPNDVPLRVRLLAAVRERVDALGLDPTLLVRGPLDEIPVHLHAHVLAVVRDALDNAARQAGATTIRVTVDTTEAGVTVVIGDDGAALPAAGATTALANLQARAVNLGGTMTVEPGPGGTGRTLSWSVPLG